MKKLYNMKGNLDKLKKIQYKMSKTIIRSKGDKIIIDFNLKYEVISISIDPLGSNEFDIKETINKGIAKLKETQNKLILDELSDIFTEKELKNLEYLL